MELIAAFRDRRSILAEQASQLGGVALMRYYSDVTDGLVRQIHAIAAHEAGVSLEIPALAVAAVGGYGRREMSPFSDVDIAFIAAAQEDDAADQVVKRAFRILVDVVEASGVKVGYSYRRLDELEGMPLDVQTALLDARHVVGNGALFAAFSSALRQTIRPAAFVASHADARSNGSDDPDTPFLVEPDVKEGRGGLRDLHSARWVAQVAFRLDADSVWDGLRSRGILQDHEIIASHDACDFVSQVRNVLHLLAGRAQDVLVADRHAQVAEALGFAGPQEFVSEYYRHANHLSHVRRKTTSACLRAELELEPGIVSRDGRLHVLDLGLLARDSAATLRVFQHARAFRLEIAPQSADLIASQSNAHARTPESNLRFIEILSQPDAGETLRSMTDTGLLQAIVPQFGELLHLVPGDAAHRYTVGEHSLRTVEELGQLFREGDTRFADAFSRVQHFEVLALAALMHDIGKLDSRRDHAKTGAFRAAKFAASLGMAEDACATVEFLVRHHLKMAETARLRDLNRPKTITDFVMNLSKGIPTQPLSRVNGLLLLDMLFLLTVADNASVGTVNWSRVQLRFFLELHERASAALRSPDAATPDIDRHRTRVRKQLCLSNLPQDLVEEHCESMPASYLLNTPSEELAAHIGFVRTVRDGSPVVDLRDDRAGEFTVLTVAVLDRPGLLSEIAGVMRGVGVDIHAAQIFTRSSTDEIAIDTLYIDVEGRQLSEMKKWQVEGELSDVLSGKHAVAGLVGNRDGTALGSSGKMEVTVHPNLSDHETVIEVRAVDFSGLLHYLTSKIAEMGWSIHSARVATWGHEARDVFYVTNASGAKLLPEQVERFRECL